MSLFHLRLLKPHMHANVLRAIGDEIHTASADVAAWLVRHGIAVHAGGFSAPAPAVDSAPTAVDPEPDPEPDPVPDLTPSTSTDTDHTGDDHE